MATSTYSISDPVRVNPPFDHTFDGLYMVVGSVESDGIAVAYLLNDTDGNDIGAFAPNYLKAA